MKVQEVHYTRNSIWELHSTCDTMWTRCEGKDKSIIINQLITRNVIIDNFIKFQLPQTWDHQKSAPRERVLSFICSMINTHISIFILQVFRRNLIETSIVPDSTDGNSKNDRYRASKMKLNEEYVTICSMDMRLRGAIMDWEEGCTCVLRMTLGET